MSDPFLRPRFELARRIVEVLAADATLQGLLFPAWAPSVGAQDARIYEARVELPANSAVRGALPRILVSTTSSAIEAEQRAIHTDNERVAFWLHIIVPADRLKHGEAILDRAFRVVASTNLSNARILASEPSWDGAVSTAREAEFGDAHRLTAGPWRCPLVGVRT